MRNIHPEFMFHIGSTPMLSFDLPEGLDPETNSIWVTFEQGWRTVLTIYDCSSDMLIKDGKVYVLLQDQITRQFAVGDVEAQVHYKSHSGLIEDHSNTVYGMVLRTQEEQEAVLIRGTTPTHTFDIGMAESDVSELTVSYMQSGNVILQKTKQQVEFKQDEVVINLTKEETLLFAPRQIISIRLDVTTAAGKSIVDDEIRLPCR